MRGCCAEIEPRDRLLRLQQAQEMERAVEGPDLAVRRDHGHGVAAQAGRADHVALVAEGGEVLVPAESGDERRARRRADDDRSLLHALGQRDGRAPHRAQPALQLGADDRARRRSLLDHDL